MPTDELDRYELLGQTTAIAVALIHARPDMPFSDIVSAISQTYTALKDTGREPVSVALTLRPAVPIRSSIKPDHIVCLEDGKKLKMLKRYLRTKFDMSIDEYRSKWGLPSDYPAVAPNYAEKRRQIAVDAGLGRKKLDTPPPILAPTKRAPKAAKA